MSQPHRGELPASSRAPVKSAATQDCKGLLAAFMGSGTLVVPLPLSDRSVWPRMVLPLLRRLQGGCGVTGCGHLKMGEMDPW